MRTMLQTKQNAFVETYFKIAEYQYTGKIKKSYKNRKK